MASTAHGSLGLTSYRIASSGGLAGGREILNRRGWRFGNWGDGSSVGLRRRGRGGQSAGKQQAEHRSEEHTSELQSLMRNSYSVFCLNKKTTITTNTNSAILNSNQVSTHIHQ